MDAHKRKALSRIILCFSLFLVLRLAEELLIIPRVFNTRGLIACLGGLVILLVYIRFINRSLEQIGMVFSRHKVRKGIVIAVILNLVSAVIAYALEYSRISATPGQTVVSVFYGSADHAYSSAGLLRFAMWMAIGVLIAVIHAVFYELAFRGLLITLGSHSMRFWKINLIQAGLYTFWFLIPVVRLILYPSADSNVRIPALFLIMLVYQMFTSVKLGLLRSSTGSVWVCIFDHIGFACILDMIHVQHTALDMTVQMDQSYTLRIICYQAVSLLMVSVYYIYKTQKIRKTQKSRAHAVGHRSSSH